jgi:hypothetical protein
MTASPTPIHHQPRLRSHAQDDPEARFVECDAADAYVFAVPGALRLRPRSRYGARGGDRDQALDLFRQRSAVLVPDRKLCAAP